MTIIESNIVTIDYLRGIIEGKGSFNAKISGAEYSLSVYIVQERNMDIYKSRDLLAIHNISSCVKESSQEKDSRKRASLEIKENLSILYLLDLLKTGNSPFIFSGIMYRDFLIMEKLVANAVADFSLLHPGEALGLIKSLHKVNRLEPDIKFKIVPSRLKCERRLKLGKDGSWKISHDIIKALDERYELHCASLQAQIENNELILDPGYVIGLLEARGAYSIHLFEPAKGVFMSIHLRLCIKKQSLLTLKIFRYLAKTKATISIASPVRVGLHTYKATSACLDISKPEEIERIYKIHEIFGPVGERMLEEYDLVKKFIVLQETGGVN
jgi:hypothetical protein